LWQSLLLYSCMLLQVKQQEGINKEVEAMERSNKLLEYPESITHELLDELKMAEEHLVRAQQPNYGPADLRYFLLWSRRHVESAKSLLEKYLRSNPSV
jgi:hypothetical protein